jgi:hypothetical protein
MLLQEELETKWGKVLDADGVAPIKDNYRRAVTALILENMATEMSKENNVMGRQGMLAEAAPINSTGSAINNYDPILISLVRRALPNLIAYDFCGVQPMTGPTGLIFAMRSRYTNQNGSEALFNESDTGFSSNANTAQVSQVGTDPVLNTANSNAFTVGTGMPTAIAEALGSVSGNNDFAEMAFDIAKVTVTARSRALKATYSMELAQDLKAIHGLDAETELANILSTEILAELNREVIRSVYRSATLGCSYGTTTAGTFDLDVDANGRWAVEKFKGLVFQIERECNAIAKATRRGKGNVMIVSSDVASALQMTGILSYPNPGYQADLVVDDTGNTFAGTMHGGRVKVFIDPYFGGSASGDELVTVGYKGTSPYDAGLFYCPYVPLQMVRAVGQDTFQPRIGFKTRYGMVANPFATTAGDGVVGERNTATQANIYYRIFRVTNLL